MILARARVNFDRYRFYFGEPSRSRSGQLYIGNACRVHSAAADLHEQLAAPGAAPVGDVTVASVLRQLGPRAPGLLHVDPREIGLADIDAAGLAPLASLFG